MKKGLKETRIYALIHDNKVFVGRSTADKLSGVVYKHLRGEHWQTKKHFDREHKRPELYILELLTAPSELTYRNWLAWIHVLEQAGYKVVNRPEVLEAARGLHPDTQRIVERIMELELWEHLENGHKERYTDMDRIPETAHECPAVEHESVPTVKLSVRMTPEERDIIRAFAEERDLTMRLALQYMAGRAAITEGKAVKLDQSLQKIQEYYRNSLQKYKKRDELMQAEIKKLREEKRALKERAAERMDQTKMGIQKYMTYFSTNTPIPMEFEAGNYRQYLRNTEQEYQYPTEKTGFAVVRPQALLYGNGMARFLMATDGNGNGIKLRFYPNKNMIGVSLWNPEFGRRGSVWLIGWEAGEENVRELCFALPMEIRPKYDDPMVDKDSLEGLLRELEQYND